MTDSLCSFCPLITPPKNIDKQIKYPTLFKQTQTFLKNKQVVLWKIRSHTDKINIRENYYNGFPRVQPYNGEADHLAETGRLHPQNKSGIPIYLNTLNQYHYRNITVCRNGTNNKFIVRQFWLRMISESVWKPPD